MYHRFCAGNHDAYRSLNGANIAYAAISGDFTALTAHGVAENSDFLSLFYMDGKPYPLISIVSDLARGTWLLRYATYLSPFYGC